MAIIDHAVKSAHTKENVVKVFSATGVNLQSKQN